MQSRQTFKKLGPKYVGPFPIKRVISPITIELELPKTLRNVHLVFHCTLLKPATTSLLCLAIKPSPNPIMIKGEQHFEIKDSLDSHTHCGKIHYLVAWKDFPSFVTEWVDSQHIRGSKFLRKFHKQYPDKPHLTSIHLAFFFSPLPPSFPLPDWCRWKGRQNFRSAVFSLALSWYPVITC